MYLPVSGFEPTSSVSICECVIHLKTETDVVDKTFSTKMNLKYG